MPDLYEFEITGTIGPLIQSCLPGLDRVAESGWTVLTGTVDGPDELRRVLDLLDAPGHPPGTSGSAYRHDESGSPVGYDQNCRRPDRGTQRQDYGPLDIVDRRHSAAPDGRDQ